MRKKRKGSETDKPPNLEEIVIPKTDSESSLSNLRGHFSMEDYVRLRKKRCKDYANDEDFGPSKSGHAIIAATAPPCGSSLLVHSGRGLKRKIGCIEAATQMGRKEKIEDDFIFGSTIGRGKFGSVCLCRSRVSGAEFACKTLLKGEETVHREVEIMQHLSGHPGIVTLKAVYEELEKFHLVMELCSEGRLVDRIAKEGRYSEHRAANIFKELMLVIKYCHAMGVVHRDIKPENILLMTSGKIKLADFGLATRVSNGQQLSGVAGSPAYVAPEVLLGNYSEKVDIWSAGILLHALLVGFLPFQGGSMENVFDAIKNAKLDFHTGIWEFVSKPARDLIERMLTRDAKERMSADEVLRHPWILFHTEQNLKPLYIKPKQRSHATATHHNDAPEVGPTAESQTNTDPIINGSNLTSLVHKRSDDCDLVDALAVAVSQVRISEPKRSKLCGPTNPLQEQYSANRKANNLCKAF